jgi:hypothetical protein
MRVLMLRLPLRQHLPLVNGGWLSHGGAAQPELYLFASDTRHRS